MNREEYLKIANIFKALSDSNRLQILKMLAKDEMCDCKILEKFNITQPTLSHHMKVLIDLELVTSRKESNWIYYKINFEMINLIKEFLNNI